MKRMSMRRLLQMASCSLILGILVGCGQHHAPQQASLTSGWTYYQDVRFPVSVPVPPGWRAGSFDDGVDTPCLHWIDVFPEQRNATPGLAAQMHEPEYISIRINLNTSCPDWNPADNQYETQMSEHISVSGSAATMYSNDIAHYAVQRATITQFSGHQYVFVLVTQETKAQQNLALYTYVLQHFTYQSTTA